MRVALTGLALVMIAGSAAAQTSSGAPAASPAPSLQAGKPAYDINTLGDLVRLCSTDRNDATFQTSMGLCAGYISGVLDYHLVDTGWSGGIHNRRVCLPAARPTRLEAIQSLVAWDSTNDRFNSRPAADGVMRYFMSTYPCPSSRSASQTSKPRG
jgi:Ssp1 endopeptidase immunity protein Rap1a